MRLHLYHVKLAQTPFGKKWVAYLVVKTNPRTLSKKPVIISARLERVIDRIAGRLSDRQERVDDKKAILWGLTE